MCSLQDGIIWRLSDCHADFAGPVSPPVAILWRDVGVERMKMKIFILLMNKKWFFQTHRSSRMKNLCRIFWEVGLELWSRVFRLTLWNMIEHPVVGKGSLCHYNYAYILHQSLLYWLVFRVIYPKFLTYSPQLSLPTWSFKSLEGRSIAKGTTFLSICIRNLIFSCPRTPHAPMSETSSPLAMLWDL